MVAGETSQRRFAELNALMQSIELVIQARSIRQQALILPQPLVWRHRGGPICVVARKVCMTRTLF